MDDKIFFEAMDKMSDAVEQRVKSRRWHQTMSGRGTRAELSQQFSYDLAKYHIGWNKHFFLVGKNDHDEVFPIKDGNVEEALQEALKFIKYHL